MLLVFFGSFSFYWIYRAMHNTGGLLLNGISMRPEEATFTYWVFASVCGLLACLGGFLTWAVFTVPNRVIEITQDAIFIPQGVVKIRMVRIPYADIENVWEAKDKRSVFSGVNLLIATKSGNFLIAPSGLADKKSYLVLKDYLVSKISNRTKP